MSPEGYSGRQELASMSNMATLIQEEENKLFGKQVESIKEFVKQHDAGLILHSELLGAIAGTYGT